MFFLFSEQLYFLGFLLSLTSLALLGEGNFTALYKEKWKCLLNLVFYCRLRETWFHTFLNFFTRIGKKQPHAVKKAVRMALEAESSTEPSSGGRKLLLSCSTSSRLKETRSFADVCTFSGFLHDTHHSPAMLCSTGSVCHACVAHTDMLCLALLACVDCLETYLELMIPCARTW